MQVDFLEAYLFHSYDSYKNFAHWERLGALQDSRKLRKIGVSVYTNEQAYDVSADERVQVVQLPFNLLDNYHQRAGALEALKTTGKEIHSRSVFLQGLFFKEKSALSGKLEALRKDLEQLDELAGEARINIAILALAYALRQPLIDRVLIGVDTETQLNQNIEMLSAIHRVNASLLSSIDQIEVGESALLNPSNW